MIDVLLHLHPVVQALLFTLFAYAMTAAGAAVVFIGRELNPKLLDGLLGFAAGAMIFVVVEELIPESQRQQANIDFVTMATMAGFATMMILDVALG